MGGLGDSLKQLSCLGLMLVHMISILRLKCWSVNVGQLELMAFEGECLFGNWIHLSTELLKEKEALATKEKAKTNGDLNPLWLRVGRVPFHPFHISRTKQKPSDPYHKRNCITKPSKAGDEPSS